MPQIEVTFDIDANGIVNVSARDKATGKEQKIRIQASGGLSDADIQRMVKDAEEHAAEDQKRKAQIEARNRAEALAHSAEKSLQEHGEKVSEEDRKAVEVAITDVRTALADETADEETLAPKVQALATASMKIGEAAYREQQTAAEAAKTAETADGSRDAEDAEVVDADYEDVSETEQKDT